MDAQRTPDRLMLVRVDPQPEFIESSGRWKWPLKPPHDNDGRCTSVVTASREWWEYVPSGAKPHPWAEGVILRDEVWYWAVPLTAPGADHRQLCSFYSVDTLEQLVDMQAHHIERLQAKLPPTPDSLRPNRVREG